VECGGWIVGWSGKGRAGREKGEKEEKKEAATGVTFAVLYRSTIPQFVFPCHEREAGGRKGGDWREGWREMVCWVRQYSTVTESGSEHPVAQAIYRGGIEMDVNIPNAVDYSTALLLVLTILATSSSQ